MVNGQMHPRHQSASEECASLTDFSDEVSDFNDLFKAFCLNFKLKNETSPLKLVRIVRCIVVVHFFTVSWVS